MESILDNYGDQEILQAKAEELFKAFSEFEKYLQNLTEEEQTKTLCNLSDRFIVSINEEQK